MMRSLLTELNIAGLQEVFLLAKAEAAIQLPVSNINEILRDQFPGRTLEAIKGKRKQMSYKELLAKVKDEGCHHVHKDFPSRDTVPLSSEFSSASPPDSNEVTPAHRPCTIYYPVDNKEVKEALKRCKNSSPGPDGLSAFGIKSANITILSTIFNICLWSHDLPKALKSKTVLIPKSGNLSLASN